MATKPFVKQFDIHWYELLDSTNTELSDLLKKDQIEEGFCIAAKSQTKGKGQGKNSWESEAGKNLCFSFLLRPDFLPPENQFFLNQVVALATRDFCSSIAQNPHINIKWPNDIYVDNKKLGGILIENRILGNTFESCIVGIGININQKIFTSDAPNPISIFHLTQKEARLKPLLIQYGKIFFLWYDLLKKREFSAIESAYKKNLLGINQQRKFRAGNENFSATIIGTDPFGRLILKDESQNLRLFGFKEVTFLFD
ncbi:MAG: biotin--[acetyl-CoA-carboxylase] ligase [Bacteroidales bacterium]|nr:biotin--[acetyl-CoA-carboxylase] ligase [Bacteroidales bacterium]